MDLRIGRRSKRKRTSRHLVKDRNYSYPIPTTLDTQLIIQRDYLKGQFDWQVGAIASTCFYLNNVVAGGFVLPGTWTNGANYTFVGDAESSAGYLTSYLRFGWSRVNRARISWRLTRNDESDSYPTQFAMVPLYQSCVTSLTGVYPNFMFPGANANEQWNHMLEQPNVVRSQIAAADTDRQTSAISIDVNIRKYSYPDYFTNRQFHTFAAPVVSPALPVPVAPALSSALLWCGIFNNAPVVGGTQYQIEMSIEYFMSYYDPKLVTLLV